MSAFTDGLRKRPADAPDRPLTRPTILTNTGVHTWPQEPEQEQGA